MAYRYIVLLLCIFVFVSGIFFIAKGDFSIRKPIFYTDIVQEKGHAGLLLPPLWPSCSPAVIHSSGGASAAGRLPA